MEKQEILQHLGLAVVLPLLSLDLKREQKGVVFKERLVRRGSLTGGRSYDSPYWNPDSPHCPHRKQVGNKYPHFTLTGLPNVLVVPPTDQFQQEAQGKEGQCSVHRSASQGTELGGEG